MTQEEINRILTGFYNSYLGSEFRSIAEQIEKLRTSIEKERDELRFKVAEAETKLKLYEAIFDKMNLNIDIAGGNK